MTDYQGFVESSNVYGSTRYNDDGTTTVVDRHASYALRIPADRFEQFMSETSSIGNVLSSNRYAENVTSTYTDYEARLSSLRTQEERLLAMLEKKDIHAAMEAGAEFAAKTCLVNGAFGHGIAFQEE